MSEWAGSTAIFLRRANPSDTDAVIAVWLASTIPGQSFISEDAWRAQEPEVRDELLPIAETWVAERSGEVVAFISVIGDVIGGLFTLPAHQGSGYGRALVAQVAATHDALFVEVFGANTGALTFYRRLGFVDHGRTIDEASGLELLIFRMERA